MEAAFKKETNELNLLDQSNRDILSKTIRPDARADITISQAEKVRGDTILKAAEASNFLSGFLSEKVQKTLYVGLADTKKLRSFSIGRGIFMSEKASTDVFVHEIGHVIESANPKVFELCKGFLYHRIGSEKPSTIFRGKSEVGAEDDWRKAFGASAKYVGKWYPDGTEILSMGLEKLFNDPRGFAVADPEFFKFIIGIVTGTLL